ncbi:hypothetical protein [Azospirillum halopraeferens]|uniref:hypothetical protein n=1 Tax=Azospirillum halopraeferens TaxID=34010 RepID=UPI0003F8691F|nr:hypothetical protein [Azospirillum halopraeferens]
MIVDRPRPRATGHFGGLFGERLAGWAFDPAQPDQRVVVDLLVDGRPLCSITADRFRPDLAENGIGDGAHSFETDLPVDRIDGAEHEIAAFVRGCDTPLPGSLQRVRFDRSLRYRGSLDVVRDGVAHGWALDRRSVDDKVVVALYADGDEVARGYARHFRMDLNRNRIGYGFHGFAIPLPAALLDGQARTLGAFVAGTDILIGGRTLALRGANAP